MKRRSRLWWYRRLRRAYKKHGADVGRRTVWSEAGYSRRMMEPERQWELQPIKKSGDKITIVYYQDVAEEKDDPIWEATNSILDLIIDYAGGKRDDNYQGACKG